MIVDEKKRMSAKDIMAHPFLQKLTENDLPQLIRKQTSNENGNNCQPNKEIKTMTNL